MNRFFKNISLLLLASLFFSSLFAFGKKDSAKEKDAAIQPDKDNAGLKLPAGFSALLVASKLGTARHITTTPEGDLYVKLDGNVNGKGILYLHDDNKDGRAETITGFGDYGGTGILIKNGYLYASSDNDVYRYKLDANNKVANGALPETIVTGLINKHQHSSKSLAIDNSGNLYVNIGAPSNICAQRGNDKEGRMPCPLLDSTGGIWMFKADKPNQTYADGVRYTTGLRNVVGLDWNNTTNTLFVMQHGRDALSSTFPSLYTTQQSAELPAECMYELHNGDNAGWPYMYYDQNQKKKIVCPEYGGDGKKEADSNTLRRQPHTLATWRPMACCFIQEICFLKNTRTVLSLLFMVHGTVHRNRRKATSWCFSHLKMVSQAATGKFLPTTLPVALNLCNRAALSTVPAGWRKVLMVRFM